MLAITIDPDATVPPSQQLVTGVLDTLGLGRLSPGERLPSVRELAVSALVNPNTVAKAYRELARLGVVRPRNGSGVFVTPEGPSLARDLRRRQSADELRAACDRALAAGIDTDELLEITRRHLGVRASLPREEIHD